MQNRSAKRLFLITLILPSGETKVVKTKAASLETAERQALKRNPTAISVKKND